ncbi:MAG TPA: ABC transporter permease [Candidatus Deferrimicrobium sp.]|nr:ABC transporter permease [Candidatus Deferrimicrobium sp.]
MTRLPTDRLLVRAIAAAGAIVVVVLLVGQFVPFFATTTNLSKVLLESAILSVAAFGMTLVLLTGGIDLSVGGVMSLVGVVEVSLVSSGIPWPAAVVVGLGVGLLLGTVNAVIVSRLKLPPFIATFGTLGIAAGLALYIANVIGHPVFPPDFVSLGNDAVLGIPIPVMLALAVLIVLEVVTRLTTWGVHLRATGDNFAVARLSGVPVARVLGSAYVVSGLLAATAGTMLAARLGTANPLQGEPYTLLAVAACVIGGVDLFGGRGHLWAAGAGAVFLFSIRNIMNLQGVQPFMQDLVTGLLIIAAVLVTVQGPALRAVASSALQRSRQRKAA